MTEKKYNLHEVTRLTDEELALMLSTYNHWRRGDCPFEEPGSQPYDPKTLGYIIDEAVLRLKTKNTKNKPN